MPGVIKAGRTEGFSKAVFENSMDAILITIPDGRIIDANRTACELLEMSVEEIRAAGRDRLIDKTDENLLPLLEERSRCGRARGEIRFIKKDGTKFPADISSSVFHDNDGTEKTVMIIRDISERRRIEDELRKSEANIRSMIESTDSSIWSIDKKMHLLVGNSAFLRSFEMGTGRRLNFGDDVTRGVPAEIKQKWIKYYKRGLAGEFFNIQTMTVAPLKPMYIRYKFCPIKNIEGKVIGLTVLSQNLTDLRKIQERLRKKTNAIQELARKQETIRDSERKRIARDLHDDLGQKLTALNLDILWVRKRIGVQSKSVQEKLQNLHDSVGSIIEGIHDVAAFLHPVELIELGLTRAIEVLLARSTRHSGIHYRFRYDESFSYINEIVSNAVYRVVQEAVTNILMHAEASCFEIELRARNKSLYLIISDDGKGITSKVSGSNSSAGIIGMRERIRIIKGQFVLISRPGKGTRIKVIVPDFNRL